MTSTSSSQRRKVFISYSHKDENWLKQLHVFLKPLERARTIDRWDDTRIAPGRDWKAEIRNAIREAKIAVLLVSAEFLASDFIHTDELPPLLAAAEEDGAVIIPVIVSPCRFDRTPALSKFQAFNPPTTPLTKMAANRQRELLVKLTNHIEDIFKKSDETGETAAVGRRPEVVPEPDRWDAFRTHLRAELAKLLGKLSPDENQRLLILHRAADALGITGVGNDEPNLKQQISEQLIDVCGEDTISSLFNFHLELCDENLDRSADKIADCIDLVLPLYISQEKVESARHQLNEGAGFAWVEGVVATPTGAALVLGAVDQGPTCFVSDENGPREEISIPFEMPAIDHPSIERQVLGILEHLALQKGIPVDKSGKDGDSDPKEVIARSKRLGDALSESMRAIKAGRKRRTPYCALKIEKIGNERNYVERVLKLVKEYVKPLIFIELCDHTDSFGGEIFVSHFVIARLDAVRKRKGK